MNSLIQQGRTYPQQTKLKTDPGRRLQAQSGPTSRRGPGDPIPNTLGSRLLDITRPRWGQKRPRLIKMLMFSTLMLTFLLKLIGIDQMEERTQLGDERRGAGGMRDGTGTVEANETTGQRGHERQDEKGSVEIGNEKRFREGGVGENGLHARLCKRRELITTIRGFLCSSSLSHTLARKLEAVQRTTTKSSRKIPSVCRPSPKLGDGFGTVAHAIVGG